MAIVRSPYPELELPPAGDFGSVVLARGREQPDKVALIFERFERAVSMRNYGGLGLGLFISRQIVEAHGGKIIVHSQPGAGSRFVVVLPRDASPARLVQRPAID